MAFAQECLDMTLQFASAAPAARHCVDKKFSLFKTKCVHHRIPPFSGVERGLRDKRQTSCGVTSQVSVADQVKIVNKHNEVRQHAQSGASAMLKMVSARRVKE